MKAQKSLFLAALVTIGSTVLGGSFFPPRSTTTLEGKVSCPYVLTAGGTAYLQLSVFAQEMSSPGRRPMNLAIVLDRSGSMGSEGKIEHARAAVRALIDKLQPDDILSIVIYDDVVEVLRPSSRVGDRHEVKRCIDEVYPRGWTNLGGGLMEGYRQVERSVARGYVNRVILLSDGLANRGVTDSEELAGIARRRRKVSISLTTIGVGLDYNENMMVSLAEGGGGSYYFVENPRTLASLLRQEFRSIASLVGQNAEIELRIPRGIRVIDMIGGEFCGEGEKHSISLGDLYAGERRDITVVLGIPPGRGHLAVATAVVRYATEGHSVLTSNTVSVGIHYTEDCAEVERNRNIDIEASAQVAASTRQVEDALRALDRGDKHEALGRLQQIQAELAASPAVAAGGAPGETIREQEKKLKAYADTIAQDNGNTARAKKSIQYENYRTQKKR